jgi:predicted secreted Zn-dependent protease
MASKLTVKVETPKVTTYKVSGKTLEEIWKDIEKKGPKDGGKARAGFTTAPVETPNDYKFDEEEDAKAKVKDGEAWKVTAKGGELKVKPVIQIAALDSDKDLSDEDKKTWSTFIKDVRDHEDEHVDATKTEAAMADFIKQYKALLDGGKLQKRLDKVNKDLDSSGHGPVLKYTKS